MRKRPYPLILAIAGIALAVLLVNLIWNGVMTTVFGLPEINYGQAFLLLLLSRLLLGGLGGHWGQKLKSHWQNLSPGERQKIFDWHRGSKGPSSGRRGSGGRGDSSDYCQEGRDQGRDSHNWGPGEFHDDSNHQDWSD